MVLTVNIIYKRTHMESRKMVLTDPSAGQQWRYRRGEQMCGHSGGKESVGRMERVAGKHAHKTYSHVQNESLWKFTV